MADRSGIEWTDATWPVVTGCTRISDGCLHCYIERTPPFRMARRRFDGPEIGATTGVQLRPDRLDQPMRWRRPRRIFVCSMADLFHNAVPDEYIADVFARMWWSPQHTFQVLTKRYGRLLALMPRLEENLRQREHDLALMEWPTPLTWPLPNVWIGVSVEDQHWADIRIPALLETPAAVRFVSCEPLLGPVALPFEVQTGRCTCGGGATVYGHEPRCGSEPGPAWGSLHWVIAGGESGPGARPMHPDWVRSLRNQCAAANVPFLFKQWGEWDADINRVGKKRAGRLLDGVLHDDYPREADR